MPTVRRVFSLYLAHATPAKGAQARAADRRRAELWARFLNPRRDVGVITRRDWERFIRERRSGAIDGRGRAHAEPDRRPVRSRTVQADCQWLNAVLRWATTWRDEHGSRLLADNPVSGLRAPRESNVRRPVADVVRYRRVRAVSDRVPMEIRWRGRREPVRSHLSEVLDLAFHTGRRLSAICRLTYGDLRLDAGPHGSVRWPAHSDKSRREMTVPLSPGARSALERVLKEERFRLRLETVATDDQDGAVERDPCRPLFPSPTDPRRPISRHLADDWLRRAERLAGLEPQAGSLWHAYRRSWATARKGLPDVDVAAAGGWKDAYTLKTVYQQPDAEGMLRAVLGEE